MRDWSFDEARNKFDLLIESALAGEPQRVTLPGQPAVVVLAADEYERLRRVEKAGVSTFAQLLLQMPQDDGEFERMTASPRGFLED